MRAISLKTKSLWLSLSILLLLSAGKTGLGQAYPVCGCKFGDPQPKNVLVRFQGAKKDDTARTGMVIYNHTLLKVTSGASAVLYCDDAGGGIQRKTLDGRDPVPPVPCSSSPNKPVIIAGGRKVDIPRTMKVPDESFPRILSPRHTKLLDTSPQISWTSIRNVSSYDVSIRTEAGDVVWSGQVNAKAGEREQIMEFPQGITLQDKVDYRVVVQAGGRSSEEDEDPNLAFSLLPERQDVIDEAKKIQKLPADKQTKALLVASLFNAHDLKYDALQTLKQLPNAEEDPESVRLIANLYLSTGLVRRAEREFLRLVGSSLKQRDSNEGQVLANTALGQIYESLGNEAKSKQYFGAVDNLTEKPALMPQDNRRSIEGRGISPVRPELPLF
jgi:hypothetical protein